MLPLPQFVVSYLLDLIVLDNFFDFLLADLLHTKHGKSMEYNVLIPSGILL